MKKESVHSHDRVKQDGHASHTGYTYILNTIGKRKNGKPYDTYLYAYTCRDTSTVLHNQTDRMPIHTYNHDHDTDIAASTYTYMEQGEAQPIVRTLHTNRDHTQSTLHYHDHS